jgi:hypothetical protein
MEEHRFTGPTIGLPPALPRPDRDKEEEERLKRDMH